MNFTPFVSIQKYHDYHYFLYKMLNYYLSNILCKLLLKCLIYLKTGKNSILLNLISFRRCIYFKVMNN